MSALSGQFEGAATSGELPVELGTDYVVVAGPLDMQAYNTVSFYAQNVGATEISSIVVESAPAESGPWVEYADLASGGALEGDTSAFYGGISGQAFKWIRLRAKVAAGSTTARFWVCVGGVR